ncbi:hypothetical protein ROZALSC1DRAFT_28454 [Rozella allomycis CSF55]|uniref:Uncharacterized protein n=1 Tax=Rozella allomycis (strain CSF55) TaxID=988480 RepID=A0A075AMJ2_ROZAC|nr:hypothetical protein O9G_003076 [Rozella allomycis CSF55]RKP20004.1 hypothetical protein ROZALSC1DRAFT_28454 [Rozella allomycis CSF55]|eukprot:EPZ30841.1 hypothetical protein O9G_003076 [Rozella allomycis CSF55]
MNANDFQSSSFLSYCWNQDESIEESDGRFKATNYDSMSIDDMIEEMNSVQIIKQKLLINMLSTINDLDSLICKEHNIKQFLHEKRKDLSENFGGCKSNDILKDIEVMRKRILHECKEISTSALHYRSDGFSPEYRRFLNRKIPKAKHYSIMTTSRPNSGMLDNKDDTTEKVRMVDVPISITDKRKLGSENIDFGQSVTNEYLKTSRDAKLQTTSKNGLPSKLIRCKTHSIWRKTTAMCGTNPNF